LELGSPRIILLSKDKDIGKVVEVVKGGVAKLDLVQGGAAVPPAY
jgi:hypothetical protein